MNELPLKRLNNACKLVSLISRYQDMLKAHPLETGFFAGNGHMAPFNSLTTFKAGHRFKGGQFGSSCGNTSCIASRLPTMRTFAKQLDYTCREFLQFIWDKYACLYELVAIFWLKATSQEVCRHTYVIVFIKVNWM